MRLLFIHNFSIWHPRSAGGQRVTHELARHVQAAGHDVLLLALGEKDPHADLPYPVHFVPDTGHLVPNAVRVAARTRRLVRSWAPDVVYGSAAEAGLVGRVLPSSVGILATLHHPDPPRLPSFAWTRPLRSLGAMRRHQGALLEAELLRSAHRVTVPSRWSAAIVHERGYVPADVPVAVVRNGVADAWFDVRPALSADAPVLFVGRLEAQKGVDVLLDALATPRLADARATIVGDGPARSALGERAEALGLGDRVAFRGKLSHAEIRALAAASSMLVCPSRHESFGMVVLEAMAAGLPVVASAVGGIPEFVDDGHSGMLVPPDDAATLAETVARLLGNGSLRARMAEAGREAARAFRWSEVAALLLEQAELARLLTVAPRPAPRRPGAALYRRAHERRAQRRAPGASTAAPPPPPADVERVAVVRFGFLGDHLLADPLIQALEERFPGAAVEVVVDRTASVPDWLTDLPRRRYRELPVRRDANAWRRPGDPELRDALGALAGDWSREPPDVLLFANELDDPVARHLAAVLSTRAGRAWRAGLSGTRRPPYLHRVVAPAQAGPHEIERLLGLALAVGADPRFRLPGTPSSGATPLDAYGGPTIVLHPGASRPARRWPAARFLELAHGLTAEYDARVVLVGAAHETLPDGSTSDDPRLVDLIGATSLRELSAVVAGADLVVANDSFPMHLAVAHGRPTVGLIGPGARKYYAYPGNRLEVVRVPVRCSPRAGEQCVYSTTCPHGACLYAIPLNEVAARCRTLLGSRIP